jgi:phenylacetate-CoA ligase
MAKIFDHLYKVSPVWLQNLGISLYGLAWREQRYGGRFPLMTRQFIEREKFTSEDWAIYQAEQLQRLLHSAWSVPYYQRLLLECNLSPENISSLTLRDLERLPMLDKQSIRLAPQDFINRSRKRPHLHTQLTSGTTGTPLEIKMSSATHQALSAAYEARCRRWAGVNHTMSRLMIGGRIVIPRGESDPPFWRYNFVERQLYFSAFHISPGNAPAYVEAINHYKPDYLVGYAVSHFLLAAMILEQKLPVHRPKAVLTSSEKLTDAMRATIEQAYHCKVFDGYSGVEACCLASECEQHNMHISPDVGLIELVDEDGHRVENGKPGQIVATGFLNHDQPLIRYQTGDVGIISIEACPCGRQMPLLKEIVGRLEDVVVGADGRQMVRFHGIFVGLSHIREGQVVQEDYSRFTLKLVVTPEFDQQDRNILHKRFSERLGKVDLAIELVESIERTQAGKFRAVISKVHADHGGNGIGNG